MTAPQEKLQQTYAERAAKLDNSARDALLASLSKDWDEAKKHAAESGKMEIRVVNLMRSIGLKLQEACGHEQVDFDFYRSVADRLPRGLSFDSAKKCVHVARKLPENIKTVDEVRALRQTMFEAFGEASAPKRVSAQTSHEANPWNDFVSTAASFTSLFNSIEADSMTEWDRDRLSKFVKTTAPIVKKHQEAQVLLEEAGVR